MFFVNTVYEYMHAAIEIYTCVSLKRKKKTESNADALESFYYE